MKVTIRRWKLKKGDLLYLDIYHRGKRVRENLEIILDGGRGDAEKLRMADILRSRRELELLSSVHGLAVEHLGQTPLVDYVRQAGVVAAQKSLHYLQEFFQGMQIRAVTPDHVEGYQAFLAERVAPGSVATYMNGLIQVLNKAVKKFVIPKSPAKGITRVKATEAPPASLLPSEVATLERTEMPRTPDGIGGEIKRAFLFACQTGLRWIDCKRLTRGRIRDRQIEVTQKKTGNPVYVPLNAAAWALINPGDRLPPPDGLVFPFLASVFSPSDWLDLWGQKAGIAGLHFHQSRHTFIRALLDSGADLATAQGLAGHQDIATTAKYGRASDKQKRAAVDRL